MSTSNAETRKAELHASLRRIAEPIAEQYRSITAELEEAQAKVSALQDARREALTVLRYVDPDNPEWAPKSYKPSAKEARQISTSRESQDKVEDWLRAHASGENGSFTDGFWVAGILKHPAFAELGLSRATIQAAVNNLADRGTIRLDRKATPPGSRGSHVKIYKLTESE
jgi:hypothetical protein